MFSEFRGLPSGYKIQFNQAKDGDGDQVNDAGMEPTCLVGLNGSGKSNILEVLAEVFYYLETYHRADKNKKSGLSAFKTNFGFQVKYILPRNVILSRVGATDDLKIALGNSNEDPLITICKRNNEYPDIFLEISSGKFNFGDNRDVDVLPELIIGYSSGMNELLSNPFIKIDFQYFEDLKEKTNEALDAKLDMNRLFFMDYDSNKYITVSNFLFDADDFDMSIYQDKKAKAVDFGGINLKYLKKETCIDDLVYFTVSLKLEKLNSDESEYLPSELNLALDKFKTCSTFCEESEKVVGKNLVKEIQYDYWVNKATKEAFRDQFSTAYELFRSFYFLQLLNKRLVGVNTRKRISNSKSGDIENLSDELPKFEKEKLAFSLHSIKLLKKSGNQIEYRKLSDGEHQLLQVVGNLLLMDTDGVLFLYDEPETHFNPGWRSKFVQLVSKSIDKTRQQELILTTHSPFIVSDCKKENVFMFSRDKNGKVKPPETPDIKTFGTAVSILTDKIFKKEESISDKSLSVIEDIRSMPLTTIDEIQAAKEASRVLGESVEKVMLFRELILKEEELTKNA